MSSGIVLPGDNLFGHGRVLVWFSCGIASTMAAKETLRAYAGTPYEIEILYCDTSASEHPDNARYLTDVEHFLQRPIKRLQSRFRDIYEVFNAVGYLKHRNGAPCTQRLKREVRKAYQRREDVHVFGFTAEEVERKITFEENNPDLECYWPLIERGITREDCMRTIAQAGIEIPMMYRLGYRNNNCVGCVKGGIGYWNRIRVDFPDVFQRMATLERSLPGNRSFSILRHKGKPCFLDELPPGAGRFDPLPDMSCGPQCVYAPDEVYEEVPA